MILVTAFKPFNKSVNNYSLEVLKYIKDVDKVILDVVYDECFNDLEKNLNLDKYDLIICMGEARMREELMIEKIARNISSCSIADNLGNLKQNEVIIKDAPDMIETKVLIDKLDVKISEDAGKFVCNNLYYHMLYNYPEKSIFIHIPNCHDDDKKCFEYAQQIEEVIKRISSL